MIKQNMSAFIKKTSMIENNNNNNNNNTKTIDDFMTKKDYLNFKLNEKKYECITQEDIIE